MKFINYLFSSLLLINSSLMFSMESNQAERQRLGLILIKAVQANNIGNVRQLIQANADLNLKDAYGLTALRCASVQDHQEMVNLLLDSGANINLQDNAGCTPIFIAIRNNINEVAALLIRRSANLDLRNKEGQTPLIWTAFMCQIDLAKLLIANSANLNIQDSEGKTALIWASERGYIEIIKLLLKAKASLNIQDNDGKTALWTNIEPTVAILIKSGANVFIKNKDQKTALDWAYKHKNGKIIKLIEDRIAQTSAIFEAINSGNLLTVKELAKKVSMGAYDANGNNPLHVAAKSNKPEIFMLILAIRPQLIADANNLNQTPLEINPGIANYLIENTRH